MTTPGRKMRETILPGVKLHPLALTNLRAERGLKTIADLAQVLGWEPQLVARLENGGRKLSFHEAVYIANTLEVSLEELLEDPSVIQNTREKNTISDELQELVRQLPPHHAAPIYAILSALVEADETPDK